MWVTMYEVLVALAHAMLTYWIVPCRLEGILAVEVDVYDLCATA